MESPTQFIQQVNQIIENNLANPMLNGAMIAKELGLSRMQLHRQMKTMTGQHATQWIQQVRIRKAQFLLGNTSKFIYEIAQEVGFKHSTYFTNIFKKIANQSPSEYRKNI